MGFESKAATLPVATRVSAAARIRQERNDFIAAELKFASARSGDLPAEMARRMLGSNFGLLGRAVVRVARTCKFGN